MINANIYCLFNYLTKNVCYVKIFTPKTVFKFYFIVFFFKTKIIHKIMKQINFYFIFK